MGSSILNIPLYPWQDSKKAEFEISIRMNIFEMKQTWLWYFRKHNVVMATIEDFALR